ncbi:unnamed protein product [Musa acuminata subsp. malaccensis]|uniref:(wild Malaysian banana) hypothetical protein n=1 Tax=Musa acuminata subsp. malaccensis TaxID=214687 RepID=A0A804KYC6_MUSAM|nr:unnamed protein product [Musa acuminata subsp. malaccensis]
MKIPKLKEKLKELAWWISSCGCKKGTGLVWFSNLFED